MSLDVTRALADARTAGVDRLDAQLLLAEVLQRPRAWLLAHPEFELQAPEARRFRTGVARRAAGEPLAYLLGRKEFHGLLLEVDAHVLVPRPDTETLVGWALELLSGLLSGRSAPSVLDLGTGSGAIALAIKQAHPGALVRAIDASPAALEVARRNAERHSLDVAFSLSDWWQALAGQRFDLVVANPPYIAAADPHLANLAAEPMSALVAGTSGMEDLQRIVADAAAHLQPAGWLLLEHGHDQANAVRTLLHEQGLVAIESRRDLAGWPRCTGGRL